MIDLITTCEEAEKHRYGTWAGNPFGNSYNYGKCAFEIFSDYVPRQCSFNNGHGVNKLYCKRHSHITQRQTNNEKGSRMTNQESAASAIALEGLKETAEKTLQTVNDLLHDLDLFEGDDTQFPAEVREAIEEAKVQAEKLQKSFQAMKEVSIDRPTNKEDD